jgi:hypothetical protein
MAARQSTLMGPDTPLSPASRLLQRGVVSVDIDIG